MQLKSECRFTCIRMYVTYIYCELEVEVERSSGIFSWFHADTFVFVCQTLALSHSLAQTHTHTPIYNVYTRIYWRSLKLSYWFFVVVILVGALHRPKWRPRARNCGARSIRNCLDACTSLLQCLCTYIYVCVGMCDPTCILRRQSDAAHSSFSCSVRSLSFHSAALCYPCQRFLVVAVVAVSRCHCLACLHLLWLCVTLVFPEHQNTEKKKK